MKRGRRDLLTPERQEKILQAVRQGNFLNVSAALAGITEETLRSWIIRGETEPSGKFTVFVGLLREAQAQSEAAAVVTVRKAAIEGDWRAAAWYLEKGPAKTRWRPSVAVAFSQLSNEEIQSELIAVAHCLDPGSAAAAADGSAGDFAPDSSRAEDSGSGG